MFIPNWTMPRHTLVVDRRCAFIAVSLLRHRQHPRQELGPVLPQETVESYQAEIYDKFVTYV